MQETTIACACCHNISWQHTIAANEMMQGTRDPFTYGVCKSCGSLALLTPPASFGPYYGAEYYSFAQTPHELGRTTHAIKHALAKLLLYDGGKLPRPMARRLPHPNSYSWMRLAHLGTRARILDVGCGAGQLLVSLATDGFTNLTGIDPFLTASKTFGAVQLFKQDIFQTNGTFDCIIFNHSLEHISNPAETLTHAKQLLAPNGIIVVRLPITGTHAWRTYGPDWVQLDAPRHLWIPTLKGIETLVGRAPLRLKGYRFDSTAFQFWGSEQYKKGIPLEDARSYAVNPRNSMFSKKEIRSFSRRARILNSHSDGDSATVYLKMQ